MSQSSNVTEPSTSTTTDAVSPTQTSASRDKAPERLLVLAFESTMLAEEAWMAIRRIESEGSLVLHDAVFVMKDAESKVTIRETVEPSPSDAALSSSFWGLIFGTLAFGPIGALVGGAVAAGAGALGAQLVDLGIQQETLRDLRAHTPPGHTSLALLVSHVQESALLAELRRFSGAQLVQSTLNAEAIARVRQALRVPSSQAAPQG